MAGLNPTGGGDSHNWNYTKPDSPGFSLVLVGTVIAIQEVQAMNFGNDGRPTTPAFWENSNQPKMNIRIVLVGPKGGYRTLTFQPASKAQREGTKPPGLHIKLFNLGGGRDMLDLIGKKIRIETQAPPAGFSYGVGNPRPWTVSMEPDQTPFELKEELDPVLRMAKVLADGAVSGGTVNAPAGSAATMPMGGDPSYQAPGQQPQPQPQPDQGQQQPVQAPVQTPAPSSFEDDIPF